MKNQEVILKDPENNVLHRADIQLGNGLVIEVQNSPIKPEEIRQRENFYGKRNMIWIINGKTLASNSSINYRLYKKAYSFHFIIPEYSSIIEGYHMDEFKEYLFETDFFQNLKDDPDLKNFSEDNGCWFEFDYYNKKDFHSIERNFYYTVREILNELYGYYDSEEIRKNFDSHFHLNHKDLYQIIVFKKKHWRKFIDECKFPVFIHLLDGLDDSLLYWYQKNKIITLKSFLNKYIKYS